MDLHEVFFLLVAKEKNNFTEHAILQLKVHKFFPIIDISSTGHCNITFIAILRKIPEN